MEYSLGVLMPLKHIYRQRFSIVFVLIGCLWKIGIGDKFDYLGKIIQALEKWILEALQLIFKEIIRPAPYIIIFGWV